MSIVIAEPPKKTAIGTIAPFRLEASQTLNVPRDEAVWLAESHQHLPSSPTERQLDPKRVEALVGRIKAGLLLPCAWATVLYDGVKYRMNGQHSSRAMLDAADLLPDRVVVHLDEYETDAPSGMGVLFRQFDARFSGRTKKDVAGAYQGLVRDLQGIDRRKAKLGIEGVNWYKRYIEAMPIPSGDDLYEQLLVPTSHAFLRWLDLILSVKTPEMARGPIVASMYATFVKSQSGSQDFWTHVAKNDLNDDDDPRTVLSMELVGIHEKKTKPKPAEYYAKCIKAWNAFRNGERIRNLSVNIKKGLPDIAQ